MLVCAVVIVVSYLIGSVPSAYVMARLRKGIDIRDFGTGNVGAANVIRYVGVWEGIVVGLADIAKGAVPILIAQALDVSQLWLLGAGFSALIGHSFPVFARFKGGIGSTVTLGIFAILIPKETGIALGIMFIPFFFTRNFGFSLLVGFTFLPVLIWLFGGPVTLIFYSLAVLAFLAVRSLPNIRLLWPKAKHKDIASGHHERGEQV